MQLGGCGSSGGIRIAEWKRKLWRPREEGKREWVFSLPGSTARTSRQLLSVLREEGQGPGINISACG